MIKRTLLSLPIFAFIVLMALPAARAEEPQTATPAEEQDQQTAPAPRGDAAAAFAASTGTAKADDLDVTVTGEAKDEVPIVKQPPSLDVPFPEITTLAREGQTERILAEQVQHMTAEQQVKLIELDSRQTVSPSMVKLAMPPFFRTEMPAALANLFPTNAPSGKSATWEYQILDQNNHVVHSVQGLEWPTKLLEWDGFDNSAMIVKVGPSYNPKILIRQPNDKIQQFYGDAIQLSAMTYIQDGLMHIEFSNDRLYERGVSDFSPDMELTLQAALDAMRLRVGTPVRIIVYESPSSNALAKKRLDRWKNLLQDKLMISGDDLTLLTMPPTDRGNITTVMMLEKP